VSDTGVVGAFISAPELVAATREASAAGFPHWETYTPYPIEELIVEKAPKEPASPVAWAMAIGGCLSAAGAFSMQEFATHYYPIEVASRPLSSWPAFVPITFELGVLGSAFSGVIALFILAKFPRLYLPIHRARGFRRASQDRFFLILYDDNPRFDAEVARAFLARMRAELIDEVAP
jgi:hypothetical protein